MQLHGIQESILTAERMHYFELHNNISVSVSQLKSVLWYNIILVLKMYN